MVKSIWFVRRAESSSAPVTGTAGVVVVSALEVPSAVAVLSSVIAGEATGLAYPPGALVLVSPPPQAASSNVLSTRIDITILNFLILRLSKVNNQPFRLSTR